MKNFTLVVICWLMVSLGFSANVNQTLYINSGTYVAVDASSFPYYSFNDTSVFGAENVRILINPSDSLFLMVINNDTITHGFNIKNYAGINQVILAGDTAYVACSFSSNGTHIYYDSFNYPSNRFMGLGGMIVVDNSNAKKFFWNIKEHQKSWNTSIAAGGSVIWNDFYPDYFTINGESNPNINLDTNARATGAVGDTIRIYMVNTGQSVHSIHFHGYHSVILQSSRAPSHVGRSKDTFPIYSMEVVVIEMIPDKVGEYPVHDHNLVAVSGGNIYPNGMFLTLLIQ